jgi:hypothetical protein
LVKKLKVDFKVLDDILVFQGRKRIWLSHTLGMPPESVSFYFSGKREMPDHYIAPIAIAIGVPIHLFTK